MSNKSNKTYINCINHNVIKPENINMCKDRRVWHRPREKRSEELTVLEINRKTE